MLTFTLANCYINGIPATMKLFHQRQQMNTEKTPTWPVLVLRLAAVYNLAWGAWVILFPNHLFDLTGIARPNYPGIWQCVGMIVGVYGIGYWCAAKDFVRHWPIILVGFLGKVLGPIGFLQSAILGDLPWAWGIMILANDVVWWLPFIAMLYLAFKVLCSPIVMASQDAPALQAQSLDVEEVSRRTMVSNGKNLWELGLEKPLLLIFVRHAGCTFCRETLGELKLKLPNLLEHKITPVVVHLGTPADGAKMLERAGLQGTLYVSNPNAELYRAYDLKRGQLSQLLGPQVWWRGFQSAILKGHGTGSLVGDGFQLGGAFLIEKGRITKSFPAKNAADPVPFECVLE